jgi:hypothetical protein
MLFLCTPINPYDFMAGYIILYVLIFIYPLVYLFFRLYSLFLLKKGSIREDIYKNLLKEKRWFWAIIGFLFMAVPMSLVPFFPFVILFFAFPIYFCFNFIFLLLNKGEYNKEEKKLFLSFYGVPALAFLFMGVMNKIKLYKEYYGNYFLDEIYYYYVLEGGKHYFIGILLILIILFVVFYLIKYFQSVGKLKEDILSLDIFFDSFKTFFNTFKNVIYLLFIILLIYTFFILVMILFF